MVLVGNFYGTGPTPLLQDLTIRGATYNAGVAAVGGGCFGSGSGNIVITGTHGSPGVPISLYGSPASCIPPGTYVGNDLDAIWVNRAAVTRSQTWYNRGVPYVLYDGLAVGHWVNPILTLEPGVILKFPPGAFATVGLDAPGGLRAVGADGAQVVFTGQWEFPGAWMGVVIGAQADSSTLLDHVVVDYAGADDGLAAAAIRLARDLGGMIRNSLLTHSAGCGIARMGAEPWTTDFTAAALNNTFAGNGGPDQCGP